MAPLVQGLNMEVVSHGQGEEVPGMSIEPATVQEEHRRLMMIPPVQVMEAHTAYDYLLVFWFHFLGEGYANDSSRLSQ